MKSVEVARHFQYNLLVIKTKIYQEKFMFKAVSVILSVFVIAGQAQAVLKVPPKKTSEQIVCDNLYQKAEESCTDIMCEEYRQDLGEEAENFECQIDGDFMEGLQICVTEGEMPRMIEAYNKKNPKPITCDQ
jgi:hypothetical protein